MKSRDALLLVLCLGSAITALSKPSQACDFCMLGQGISPYLTSEGAGLTFAVSFTESDTVYNKTSEVSSGLQKEAWLIYSLTGFHAITDLLSLQVTLPFAAKTNLDFDAGPPASSPGVLTQGLGDVTVTARYTLMTQHTLESTLMLAALIGVKLPTGSTDIRDVAGNPVDRHALPGTGSFDFPLGFTGAYSFGGSYQITAQAIYNLTTTGSWSGDPHRYGNSLNYSVKGFYRPFFSYVGFSGETTGEESGARSASGYGVGVQNLSSGGTVIYWNLGLYANLGPSTIVNGGFSKAFYHNMNFDSGYDSDPAENYKIDFAVTYLF